MIGSIIGENSGKVFDSGDAQLEDLFRLTLTNFDL
jgi:hypothetical protein